MLRAAQRRHWFESRRCCSVRLQPSSSTSRPHLLSLSPPQPLNHFLASSFVFRLRFPSPAYPANMTTELWYVPGPLSVAWRPSPACSVPRAGGVGTLANEIPTAPSMPYVSPASSYRPPEAARSFRSCHLADSTRDANLLTILQPFFGAMGCTAAIVFTCFGASYGTAKSGVGIASMGVLRPDLIVKSTPPPSRLAMRTER